MMRKFMLLLAFIGLSATAMAQDSQWFVQTNFTWNAWYGVGDKSLVAPFHKFPGGGGDGHTGWGIALFVDIAPHRREFREDIHGFEDRPFVVHTVEGVEGSIFAEQSPPFVGEREGHDSVPPVVVFDVDGARTVQREAGRIRSFGKKVGTGADAHCSATPGDEIFDACNVLRPEIEILPASASSRNQDGFQGIQDPGGNIGVRDQAWLQLRIQ